MTTLRLKRRISGGAVGAPITLATTEPAYNESDDILYLGFGDNGAGVATSIRAVAGSGAFIDKTTDQTIAGTKTFSITPTVGTIVSTDNSTKAASTGFVKAQGYLLGNQTITLSGDVTGTGATGIVASLANTGVTGGTYTKVTVDSKGRTTAGSLLIDTDIPILTSAKISDFDTKVRTNRLDQMSIPISGINLNNQSITNLLAPINGTDAANKAYVDGIAQGLDIKPSVIAATTVNIVLSAPQTVDGIILVANNRVLVKNQTAPSQNGIYTVAAGSWIRSEDANLWDELISAFVFVETGAVNADTGWVSSADAGGTLGTTSISFTQFSGAGQVVAGSGLTLTGNTLDIVGTANRVTITSDSIDISSTYVGQGSITTLGAISTGTWNANTIEATKGGTGQTGYAVGDFIYASTTTTLSKRIIGVAGDILSVVGGLPTWSSSLDGGTF